MSVHPESVELHRGLVRCLPSATAWAGIAFRASTPRYASRDDVLTGVGSRVAGGRWNPLGAFRTVYLSLTAETAVAEYLGQYAEVGFEAARLTPFVVIGVEARLRRVLDLTAAPVRRSLGVTLARLLDDDWKAAQDAGGEALTQAIGRLACQEEFDGLVVPSAARRGAGNLVVFPANLLPPEAYLRIVNSDQLPAYTGR
jgi:RES domain-containing protein